MLIKAHSVPRLASGLSPMQERLIRSGKHVRLVSAPTGSGKSYAFMHAVLDEGAHVLFIVPTKRLLQNLINDARDQARKQLQNRGWNEIRIQAWMGEQIIEWSGNQAEMADESLSATRAGQVLNTASHLSGRVIFAIPEVVVGMISGIRVKGASAVNPFLYLRQFDHVVFDEFHTINDRAFGLVCLLALIAVTEQQGKISLLSATPIDVTNVLQRIGIDPEHIEYISEEIVDGHPNGHRQIHGDVILSQRECGLSDSIRLSIADVRASIKEGSTVIVIYDSLRRLKQDEPDIRETLIGAGVKEIRILTISSIDDSESKSGEPKRGRRYADPREYDVLLCTSSVEIGVTFHSTLMFTEVGQNLASFVQRIGRVARGAYNGNIIVSLSEDRKRRSDWTRTIATIIEEHEELDVETLTAKLLKKERNRMEPTRKERETDPTSDIGGIPFYRRTSWRGAFWAALFIVAITRTKMTVQKGAREHLRKMAPKTVGFINAKIGEILSVDVVNDNLRRNHQPHKRWVDTLLESALAYREIGETIQIVDPNGTRHNATESFLHRATNILDRFIISDEDGTNTIKLLSRTLDQEIRAFTGKSEAQRLTWNIQSPIEFDNFTISIHEREKDTEQLNVRMVEAWRHQFDRLIPRQPRDHDDPRKKVIGAATALIERLGRPPLDEHYDNPGESAMFA